MNRHSFLITFGLLVALECLIVFHRFQIPIHDTAYAILTYLGISRDFAATGSLYLWNPLRSFGVPGTMDLVFQFHPFFYPLLLLCKAVPQFNAVYAVELAYIAVSAFLGVSGYKLSCRLTGNKTAAYFVGLTLTGSAIWFASPSFNMLVFWAIPISLIVAINGLDNKTPSNLFLSLAFLAFGEFQGNAYLGPMSILFYSLFLSGYIFWKRESLSWLATRDSWPAREVARSLFITSVCLAWLAAYLLLFKELRETVFLSFERNSNSGSSSFDQFLTFATKDDLFHIQGLFLGLEHSRDSVSYAGLLTMPLVLYAILWAKDFRRLIPITLPTAVLFLLWLGRASFVGPILYYVPGFSFYRHLGLLVPLVKFGAIFLAGFGLCEFLDDLVKCERKQLLRRMGICFLPTFIALIHYSGRNAHNLPVRFALVCFCLVFVWAFLVRLPKNASWTWALGLILIVDLGSFYSHMAYEYLRPATDEVKTLFTSEPRPWPDRRVPDGSEPSEHNALIQALSARPPEDPISYYDALYQAARVDSCFSKYRRFIATKQVGEIFSALHAFEGRDTVTNPFTEASPSLRHAAACEFPIIQTFTRARKVMDPLKSLFASQEPSLFIQDQNEDLTSPAETTGTPPIINRSHSQLTLNVKGMSPGTWVYISQAWNPNWQASLDSKPLSLVRANHAFMAVRVENAGEILSVSYSPPWGQWPTRVIVLLNLLFCLAAFFALKTPKQI